MPAFPTLASGAIVQFPLEKALVWRSIRSVTPGGRTVIRHDEKWRYIEWKLRFHELSQDEANAIEQLYLESMGGLRTFTFVDPAANLLSDADNLLSAEWQASAVSISITAENSPADGASVYSVTSSAALGSLSQSIAELPEATFCLSVYARGASGTFIRLKAGSQERPCAVNQSWRRCWVASQNIVPQGSFEASIMVPAGSNLLISAPQLEAQPAPSPFKNTVPLPAIYPNTRFAADPLRITATAPDRYAAEIRLVTHM